MEACRDRGEVAVGRELPFGGAEKRATGTQPARHDGERLVHTGDDLTSHGATPWLVEDIGAAEALERRLIAPGKQA
jgi:hypothetical protein